MAVLIRDGKVLIRDGVVMMAATSCCYYQLWTCPDDETSTAVDKWVSAADWSPGDFVTDDGGTTIYHIPADAVASLCPGTIVAVTAATSEDCAGGSGSGCWCGCDWSSSTLSGTLVVTLKSWEDAGDDPEYDCATHEGNRAPTTNNTYTFTFHDLVWHDPIVGENNGYWHGHVTSDYPGFEDVADGWVAFATDPYGCRLDFSAMTQPSFGWTGIELLYIDPITLSQSCDAYAATSCFGADVDPENGNWYTAEYVADITFSGATPCDDEAP